MERLRVVRGGCFGAMFLVTGAFLFTYRLATSYRSLTLLPPTHVHTPTERPSGAVTARPRVTAADRPWKLPETPRPRTAVILPFLREALPTWTPPRSYARPWVASVPRDSSPRASPRVTASDPVPSPLGTDRSRSRAPSSGSSTARHVVSQPPPFVRSPATARRTATTATTDADLLAVRRHLQFPPTNTPRTPRTPVR